MKEITLQAKTENLTAVIDFINAELEANGCPMRTQMQIELAVEEIFVNIAHYAYQPAEGEALVQCSIGNEPLQATIRFLDGGFPYNPLARDDPDTTLPIEERDAGGLGVLLVKKTMDGVDYEYKDGKNILTIRKRLK
jgi:serine/threonine-protein kinase RsbW